ncbi:TetR/AcrR family transcriptional regulator [Marinactinospora thermotolerans]|uniref:Transcriptional regulator, TetR family n=1 Tax=Marinactinospora thermotolerans DSM 45154 TaxID=1122192 RepID=A0A1T4PU46_9ACTN|nr:TetR/AcrR family transcriptional regulator [Marinactinospora thermotolerans]SJZ94791.1 transcriptional regulator, TetR family [Marinactinospora thermotolerans DSM 45154]
MSDPGKRDGGRGGSRPGATAGLREQKKRQTRQAISDTATRMFVERGFENVTIAEIAAAAQVAKMTVTNYFPRKEDLALDLGEQFTSGLARAVAERAPGESALDALHRSFLAAVARRDPVIGFAGPEFTRMVVDSPTLMARLRDFHDIRENALAEALAATTGTAGDVTPRAAAALLAAAHRVLFEETVRLTLQGRGADRIAAELTNAAERIFGLLRPALGDYAVLDGARERPGQGDERRS